MNAEELLQTLNGRNKSAGSDTQKLKSVLDDYQIFLKELRSQNAEDLILRRLEEESRDFPRLITKGHGQILHGRISDGLRALKPIIIVEAPDETPDAMTDVSPATGEDAPQSQSGEETKRFRNLPNLGMD